MNTTTVRLKSQVKKRLESLKNFDNESFDEVVNRLINVYSDTALEEDEIKQIRASLEDIEKGRVLSLSEAEKKWGV